MSTLELENIKHPDNANTNIALASNGSIIVDRRSTDGTIIDFRKSGTTVGTIGVDNGDNLTISGNSHAGLNFSDNDINPYKNGAYADGIIDLGYTTSRFKDLHLSGGIYVGGQSSANYLDDYEEGTWTPADDSGASMSLTVWEAFYTKIGRKVYIEIGFLIPSNSSSAVVRISGLPFAAKDGNDNTGGFTLVGTNSGRLDYWLVTRGASRFGCSTFNNVGAPNSSYSNKQIKLNGSYTVA